MSISDLEDILDTLDNLVESASEDDEHEINQQQHQQQQQEPFSEEDALELIETALHLMDEFVQETPSTVTHPRFREMICDEIKHIFQAQLEGEFEEDDDEDENAEDASALNELLEIAFSIFILLLYPERSCSDAPASEITSSAESVIETNIQRLRAILQPEQRTPEWYQFRWNLITASNAWKAFENQTTVNQLIFEKCQPLVTAVAAGEAVITTPETKTIVEKKPVNLQSPMHWGQKYEPVTVMLYEAAFHTTVEEFGCIQHPQFSFIGASPDGINVDKKSDRYGRMLEIKNVVNREITGIPKKEYWVQMQLQMEVCDLDECDFLETKFTEFENFASFAAYEHDKGIIIHFHSNDKGGPVYIYKPLHLKEEVEITKWEEDMLQLYESEEYNYVFMTFLY